MDNSDSLNGVDGEEFDQFAKDVVREVVKGVAVGAVVSMGAGYFLRRPINRRLLNIKSNH